MRPFARELLNAIEQRRAELIQTLGFTHSNPEPGARVYEHADIEQMVNGFLALLVEALEERPPEVRTFFLQTAMPALRDSGTTLHTMMRGSVQALMIMSITLTQHVSPEVRDEARGWLSSFTGAYVAEMADLWLVRK